MNAGEAPIQKELFPETHSQGQSCESSGNSDFNVRQGPGGGWSVELIDRLVGAKNAHAIPSVNWLVRPLHEKTDPHTVRFLFSLSGCYRSAPSFLASFGG